MAEALTSSISKTYPLVVENEVETGNGVLFLIRKA